MLNAIDWETFFQLQAGLEEMIADPAVRVIVLTGAGEKSFISGGDIGEELKMNGLTSYRWSLTGHKLCATIEGSPKPVIAAVNDEANLVEKEHKIDLIRWNEAAELATFDYFDVNAILSYLVRINIVARWTLLDAARGREMFARLLAELDGKELINKE